MGRNLLLVISLLVNIFLIAYIVYTHTKKEDAKSIYLATEKVSKLQKDIQQIEASADELAVIYVLLSEQTAQTTKDLNHLANLNSKTVALAFISEKEKDTRKRERLIDELLQWCDAKQGFHVYIKAQKEQLRILLKRLKSSPSEETLIDIQYTIRDMMSTIIKRLYMQSGNFEITSKRVQNRIDDLRKSIVNRASSSLASKKSQ